MPNGNAGAGCPWACTDPPTPPHAFHIARGPCPKRAVATPQITQALMSPPLLPSHPPFPAYLTHTLALSLSPDLGAPSRPPPSLKAPLQILPGVQGHHLQLGLSLWPGPFLTPPKWRDLKTKSSRLRRSGQNSSRPCLEREQFTGKITENHGRSQVGVRSLRRS